MIRYYVGGIDKSLVGIINLEAFYRKHESKRGHILFDFQYIPDPNPNVFPEGIGRVSYKFIDKEEICQGSTTKKN